MMRFHVINMPHTQTTAAYSNCAFASLGRGFATMMMSLGHEVIVYSGEENDAPCTEHVAVASKKWQADTFRVRGPEDILTPPLDTIMYEPQRHWWGTWNRKVISALEQRLQPQDFVCIIGGGVLFEPTITYALNRGAMAVEYAVGYAGISARTFHAFGCTSWRHVVFGLQRPEGWLGSFYDRTIPHYFNPDDFEYRENDAKGDYFLYLGKIKQDKGVNVAARAAQAAGVKLILAGDGPTPVEYGEVLRRRVGPDERRELLAGARGVFTPSLYTEPFGMIAVEALLSGTPVISTPFGGFSDIVTPGSGYQCNTMRDFVLATKDADAGIIDAAACRARGMEFSYDVVRWQYERWFNDLLGLYGEGWGAL
jgi:glycosyltransferase involved in cell wall biosynthesis